MDQQENKPHFRDLGFSEELLKSIESTGFTQCTPIQASSIPVILKGHDIAGLAQTGTGKTAAFLLPLMERIYRGQKMAHQVSHHSIDEDDQNQVRAASEPSPMRDSGEEGAGVSAPSSESEAQTDAPEKNVSVEATQESTEKAVGFKDWRNRQFVLVLVPTRELAEQVVDNIQKLKGDLDFRSVAIYGGVAYQKQTDALKQGVEFVVATPGRLIDLYKEHQVDLKQVRAVVFDEADRMFDMGFKDDMKYILSRIPKDRQFLVFSATLNLEVLNTAYQFGAHPVEVNISKDEARAENVEDFLFHVGTDEKPKYLLSILKKEKPKQAIIFSNYKLNIERIAKFLQSNGCPALGISSMLTQAQRTRVIEQFKSDNEQNIMVATDVAARGLDIKGVDMVINFELPEDAENYVHRIGRTGRAGQKGKAYSLVSENDVDSLSRIEAYLKNKLEVGWLEDSEIIQEHEAFPSQYESRRPSAHGNQPRKPRATGPGGRSDRGPRDSRRDSSRGRDGERGPRSERPDPDGRTNRYERSDRGERSSQGGRSQGSERTYSADRNRGRNNDELDSRRRSRNESGQGETARAAGQVHRDRRTGRHKDARPENQAVSKNASPRNDRSRYKSNERGYKPKPRTASAPKQSVVQKVKSLIGGLFKKKK